MSCSVHLAAVSFPWDNCLSSQVQEMGFAIQGKTGSEMSGQEAETYLYPQVFLSARSSTWVFSRVSDHGFPFDMVSTTRFNHFLDWLLPSALTRRIRFRKFNSWFNHANYGLASTKRCFFLTILLVDRGVLMA